jgi:hypothetical protein
MGYEGRGLGWVVVIMAHIMLSNYMKRLKKI